jgi:hypothetical protein
MKILDKIRSDFRGYIEKAEELLSDQLDFDSEQATQMLNEAHNLASSLVTSHHDISTPHFRKFGGRDAPYGVQLRLTAVPQKPFALSKTHYVVLVDRLDLSVLPDDEHDETTASESHPDSTIPF